MNLIGRRANVRCVLGAMIKRAFRLGGLHTAMIGLSQALALRGVQATAFGTHDSALEQDRQAWGNTELITDHTLGPAAQGYSPALVGALKHDRLDLLHQD